MSSVPFSGKMQSGEALLETRSGAPLSFSAGAGVALESSGKDDVGRSSTSKDYLTSEGSQGERLATDKPNGVMATYLSLVGGFMKALPRYISRAHLDVLYKFKESCHPGYAVSGNAKAGELVLHGVPLAQLVDMFGYWTSPQLRALAFSHGVSLPSRCSLSDILGALRRHNCQPSCNAAEYVFQMLSQPRKASKSKVATSSVPQEATGLSHESDAADITADSADDTDSAAYLEIADAALREAIIKEWEVVMSLANLKDWVCAVCGRCTPESKMTFMKPNKVMLALLRNDRLPDHLQPISYNREAYDGALLNPKGMTDIHARSNLKVCNECRRDLVKCKMPRFSLANWLYYAYERLPAPVRTAFRESSQVERMLVARARASKISFKFTELKGHELHDTESKVSQRFLKGNVSIHPQDATHLNEVLPPSNDVIRDTVCAVFVGKTKPTPETIKSLRPVLVRKSRVKTIINFLVDESGNPGYEKSQSGFRGFSSAHLDELFGDSTKDIEEGVPCSIEIGHIDFNEAVEGATDSYVPGHEVVPGTDNNELLMENVGYVDSDDTPRDNNSLSMRAVSHCLHGGKFIKSQAGSRFIPDFENPLLLTWLFPHLDPWGIGGFHDPRRLEPLSLEQQLKYLLMVHDSPFRDDPDFAFVYYNIKQKKAVFDSVVFRVPAFRRERVVTDLLNIDVERLDTLMARFKVNPNYKPTDPEESRILRILLSVNTVSHDLPGSNGYKLALRNEIRGLINYEGTPTLFITLNPSDRDHPLVQLYAGHEIDIEGRMRGEELSRWDRSIIAARNPSACARFFHAMMSNFIKVVLRYDRPGKGLFGKCKAYYGTVEAQGRGTLHCHMLIWLEGHPSPQKLRDKMMSSNSYRDQMFRWLESVIKCELPHTEEVVVESPGHPIPRPRAKDESGVLHPGAEAGPSIHAYQRREEFQAAFDAFVSDLVKAFNWHEHSSTCFKYAPGGTIPDDPQRRDALCRMRIDGTIRAKTELDDETGGILLRRLHPRIASYNDLIIFLMKCNMDIKFIGSGEAAKALLYYVTDYITKANLPVHIGLGALSYAIQKVNEKFPNILEEKRSRSALIMTINRMMSSQEVSHQQVMSYLVGGGDVYRSHHFKVLYWGAFDRLFRRYFNEKLIVIGREEENAPVIDTTVEESVRKVDADASTEMTLADEGNVSEEDLDEDGQSDAESCHENEQVEEESFILRLGHDGSISASNQQQDYVYRCTSAPFDALCLYEFVGITDKVSKVSLRGRGPKNEDDDADKDGEETRKGGRNARRHAMPNGLFSSSVHTQFETHGLKKRIAWSVPVLLGDRVPRSDRGEVEREAWARMMLILFVPWRSPSDLRATDESWLEAFERQRGRILPQHCRIIDNMNVLSECRDVRDTYREMRRAEALAFMKEGFSGPDNAHTGRDVDEIGDDYELFDKSDIRDIYASVDNDAVARASLDQTVGSQARQALDICYAAGNEVAPCEHSSSEFVRLRREDDAPMLASQMSNMRHLKRQRRPEHEDVNAESRSRKRKKFWEHEAEESVSVDTLGTDHEGRRGSNTERVSVADAIKQVVTEMHLSHNEEQHRAFRIVAEHAGKGENDEQLLMYIAGVGGTGKTHVVHAILRLFELLGRSEEVMVGAPTGAAALNIGGYTVHSLMMLPCKKTKSILQKLRALWSPVKYFIIDEVSMIGARFLAEISRRLQQAKGDTGPAAIEPFGGINVIFTGDFGQLRPVEGPCLYSHQYINHPGLQNIREHTGVDKLKGIFLWRQVETVVQLTKNQRQASDPQYGDLLSRVRTGQGRMRPNVHSGELSDVDILSRRTLQQVAQDDPASLQEFGDAPVIVGRRTLRDAINARIIQHKVVEAKETIINLYARDQIERKSVPSGVQKGLWKLSSSQTGDALSCLPVFRGMRVMIRENIAFSRRLVNGAEGIVRGVVHEVVDGVAYPTVAYVEVPGAGKICEELGEDIVPVFPERTRFKCKVRIGSKAVPKWVSRLQLPLLPAYAYTDYKSQGKTLSHAIVDLQSTSTMQGAYVMLSRVRCLKGLLILRPFTPSKVCGRLSEELRIELDRIELLAQATARRFEACHQYA